MTLTLAVDSWIMNGCSACKDSCGLLVHYVHHRSCWFSKSWAVVIPTEIISWYIRKIWTISDAHDWQPTFTVQYRYFSEIYWLIKHDTSATIEMVHASFSKKDTSFPPRHKYKVWSNDCHSINQHINREHIQTAQWGDGRHLSIDNDQMILNAIHPFLIEQYSYHLSSSYNSLFPVSDWHSSGVEMSDYCKSGSYF